MMSRRGSNGTLREAPGGEPEGLETIDFFSFFAMEVTTWA